MQVGVRGASSGLGQHVGVQGGYGVWVQEGVWGAGSGRGLRAGGAGGGI